MSGTFIDNAEQLWGPTFTPRGALMLLINIEERGCSLALAVWSRLNFVLAKQGRSRETNRLVSNRNSIQFGRNCLEISEITETSPGRMAFSTTAVHTRAAMLSQFTLQSFRSWALNHFHDAGRGLARLDATLTRLHVRLTDALEAKR